MLIPLTPFISSPLQISGISDDLVFGAACYVGSFALLSAWEGVVVPRLKLRGIIPDVPILPGALSERERAARWIVPLTSDRRVPLPDLETLRTQGHHCVGKAEGVPQLISLATPDARESPGVRVVHSDWSDFYETPILLYKQKSSQRDLK